MTDPLAPLLTMTEKTLANGLTLVAATDTMRLNTLTGWNLSVGDREEEEYNWFIRHGREMLAELAAQRATVATLLAQLDRARAVMLRAMDALKSDSELDQRREAFEMIQAQFEGVPHEDCARAEALIRSLRAKEKQ